MENYINTKGKGILFIYLFIYQNDNEKWSNPLSGAFSTNIQESFKI